MQRLDLAGRRFGRLTVVEFSHVKNQATFFLCRCDCGREKTIRGAYLSEGDTKSCGCLQKEAARKMGLSTKKPHRDTMAHRCWSGMKQRCFNKNSKLYIGYGGRGITVCKRWLKFDNFFADMGERPPGMQIERRDNNGNYCPENCYWATRKQQQRNRRPTLYVQFRGKREPLSKLCEEAGVKYQTAYFRLRNGLTIEEVLAAPAKPYEIKKRHGCPKGKLKSSWN
jgi:hypothetical protein